MKKKIFMKTVSAAKFISVESRDARPFGIFFKPDGLKMYIAGDSSNRILEYNLSTSWEITTAVHLQNFNVVTQDDQPFDVFFKPDGLKMYVIGNTGDKVYEYNLSTAWNVTTAVYLQDFSVTAQDSQPLGLFFKPDGLKMYVAGFTNSLVLEYDLSTPWSITTAVYLQSFNVATQDNQLRCLFFKSDGLKMYVTGTENANVYEYDLSVPWDITTSVYLGKKYVGNKASSPFGLFFKTDFSRMYVVDFSKKRVYQFKS